MHTKNSKSNPKRLNDQKLRNECKCSGNDQAITENSCELTGNGREITGKRLICKFASVKSNCDQCLDNSK